VGPSSGRPVDVSFCRPGVLDQRMWTWFLMTARLPWRPQIATPDNSPKRNPMCRGGGGEDGRGKSKRGVWREPGHVTPELTTPCTATESFLHGR